MALAASASIWPVLAGTLLTVIGIGMAEPSLAGIAVSAATCNVGIYSAVMGTMQYLLGAAGTPLSGAALGGGPGTWGLALVVVAGIGFGVTWLATRPAVAEAGADPVSAPARRAAIRRSWWPDPRRRGRPGGPARRSQ